MQAQGDALLDRVRARLKQSAAPKVPLFDQVFERMHGHKRPFDVFDAMARFREAPEERLPFAGAAIKGVRLLDVLQAVRRMESDKATNDDVRLVASHYSAQQERAERGTTLGSDIFGILEELPAFGLEFFGSGGAFTAGRKASEKLLARALKEAVDRGVGKAAQRVIAGAAGVGAQQVAQSALTLGGRELSTMVRLALPPGQIIGDHEAAELVLQGRSQNLIDTLGPAVVDQYIELATERSGGLFARLKPAQKIGLLAGQIGRRWIQAKPGRSFGQFMALLDKAGYQGPIAEMLEERAGEVLRASGTSLGLDMAAEWALPEGQQLLAELISFTLPMAGAGALAAVVEDSKQGAGTADDTTAVGAASDSPAPAAAASAGPSESASTPAAAPAKAEKAPPTMDAMPPRPPQDAAQRFLDRVRANGRVIDQPEDAEDIYAVEAGRAHGTEVVLIKPDTEIPVDAAYMAPGVLVLNVDSPKGLRRRALIVHELLHHLKATAGDSWDALYERVLRADPTGLALAKQRRRAAEADLGAADIAPPSPERADEEALGAYFEDMAGLVESVLDRPSELERARRADPSFFQGVLDAVVRTFNSLTGAKLPDRAARQLKAFQVYTAKLDAETKLSPKDYAQVGEALKEALDILKHAPVSQEALEAPTQVAAAQAIDVEIEQTKAGLEVQEQERSEELAPAAEATLAPPVPAARPKDKSRGYRRTVAEAKSGGRGIISLLRSFGGIAYYSDLAGYTAKEGGPRRSPGFGPLVNPKGSKKGITLDFALEEAMQAGAFPGHTDSTQIDFNDLMEVIDRELAAGFDPGKRVEDLEKKHYEREDEAAEFYKTRPEYLLRQARRDRAKVLQDAKALREAKAEREAIVSADELVESTALTELVDDVPFALRRPIHPIGAPTEKQLALRQTGFDRAREFLVDQTSAPRRIQTKGGAILQESEDYGLHEDLRRGRAKDRIAESRRRYLQPMIDKMAAAGLEVKDIDEHFTASHAEERNELGIVRDASRFGHEHTPFSGLRTSQARATLAKHAASPQGKVYDQIQALFDDMLLVNRQGWVSDGLSTPEEVEALDQMFEHYAPQRTDYSDEDYEEVERSGRGINIRGREYRRAFGRSTIADSPLAFAWSEVVRSQVRGEKNRAAGAYFKWLKDHNDPWIAKIDVVENRPILLPSPSGADEPPATDAPPILIRFVGDPSYADAPNVWSLKVDGKEHHVTFQPQFVDVAVALKGIGATSLDAVSRRMSPVTRMIAQLSTRYNPVFPAVNLPRDVGTAFIVNAQRGISLKVLRRTPWAIATLFGLGGAADKARLAEYQEQGAPITFLDLGGLDGANQDIRDAIRTNGTIPRKTWEKLKLLLTTLNDSVENASRFASFMVLRDQGESAAKAAQYAKNLTVNFERRGNIGNLVNAWYMFANAGIQGSDTVYQSLKHPGVRRMLAGAVAGFAGLSVLARLMGGDDEDDVPYYDKITENEKNRYLIFMVPGGRGKRIRIPMPYGFAPIFTAGRLVSDAAFGVKTPIEATGSLWASIWDNFNPLGGGGDPLEVIIPTVVDPFVEYARNRDWAGRLIRPQDFDKSVPESNRYWPDVNPAARSVATFLNRATGGTRHTAGKVSVSPEGLEHFLGAFSGGLGQAVMESVGVVQRAIDPDERVRAEEVPLLKRFYAADTSRQDQSQFRANRDIMKAVRREERDAVGPERTDVARRFGGLIAVQAQAKTLEKRIGKLQDRVDDEHLSNDHPQAQKLARLLKQYNALIRSAKK